LTYRAPATISRRVSLPFGGLDHARARSVDEECRDQERARVGGEDSSGAGGAVQEACERRADQDCTPAGDADQRVRGSNARLLDHERHHAAERRVEEAVAEPDENGDDDQDRERDVAGRVDGRKRSHRDQPRQV
jgi:hypothetical protein